jgi:endonuclease III
MTVINSLGVNALSIRGAGTDYHRLSRVYESLAEANADSGFSATAGVEHVALIKGIGLAFYNHSTSQWEHTATELEANVDDLISLAGVGENTANLGTFSGSTIADNQTIKQALQTIETTLEAIDLDTDDMAALTGLAENVTNLGTFTGSTISDSSTVKTALQALETSLETMSPSATVTEIDGNVDDLISLTGVAENTANLGTFSGSTIADSVTVKAALQALETALELKAASSTVTEVDGNVDDVISVLGVAENVTHLGTFSGSTISDSQTIKQALQALETALELKAASTTVSEIDGNVDDLVTLTGMSENSSDLGTFAGSIIADNVSIKQALQSLETLLQDTDGNTDSLIALTGITENVSHLGTFTGSTITDSTTVKAALQELETSTELKFDKAGGTVTGNVTVSKSFPDFQLRANDEKRLIFADAGGAGTAALKHTSTTLDFFVGGIASGNKEMSLGTDGLDVTALKIDGTAITATATELNYVDGVSSAIQTQLDSKLAISGAAAAIHLDDLLTAVGIASEGLHLGTFLGSTISDNTTVKSALQELELSNELKATIASPAFRW